MFLAGGLATAAAQALQPVPVPAPTARVVDLAGLLAAGEIERLEARLAAFEREKGAQVVVLLVPTTQPESIEAYALRVAESWRPGRKGVDDGVLLLVARDDRALRIEVGYGLEGALNDATAKRIIAETITPHFREGRFHDGIEAGIGQILAVIDGEPLPPPAAADEAGGDLEGALLLGLILSGFIGSVLRALFGRLLGAAIAGGVVGLIVMFVMSSLALAIGAGFIAFIVALLSGGGGGRGGGRGGSWGGGTGRSGWGGGGFSGGGGGFGGGGASGRW
ncbi:MAG: TPM domain-containing protein [Azospira sp.]|nr:TPM domain-containing protein [Azospira sp.]